MRINYNKQALKYLAKLDRPTRQRLKDDILHLADEPPEGDIRPMSGQENLYRLRIGGFRIIFEIDVDNNIIEIRKISPRGDAYK